MKRLFTRQLIWLPFLIVLSSPGKAQTVTLASNHPPIGNVFKGVNESLLAGYSLAVAGGPVILNTVSFTSGGSYSLSDISGFKLFYGTSSSFINAYQISSSASVISGSTITFSGLSQSLPNGNGYLFVSAGVSSGATTFDNIFLNAATASNFTFSASPAVSGVAGISSAQTIRNIVLTPGNIVLNRVGDGSTSLNSAAAPVSFVELTQSGGPGASPISFPSSVSGASLTNSGSATSEGALSLSGDASRLVNTGYAANAGTASVATSADNRIIGQMDAAGSTDLSTVFPTFFGSLNIRSAVRDGYSTNVWAAGNNGISYSISGTTSNGTTISSANLRWLQIFAYINAGGTLIKQLYCSNGTSILSVGSGLPTTSSSTSAVISALNNPFEFVMLDADPAVTGPDVIYIADKNGGVSANGVFKFVNNGSSWIAKGTLTGQSATGIQGYLNASGQAVLFITSTSSGSAAQPSNLFSYTDANPSTATLSGAFTGGGPIATAGSNYSIRGIAFSPTFITSQPASTTICAGIASSFTVGVQNGTTSKYDYFWQRSSDGGLSWSTITASTDGGIYTGYNTASLNLSSSVSTAQNNFQYRCYIEYMSQYWLQSNPALLTVNSNGRWLGTVSNDWHTAANWCGGVPGTATDVIIPFSAPNQPLISLAPNAFAHDITFEGGSLTFTGSTVFSLYGNIVISPSGILNSSAGDLYLESSGTQTIPAGILTNLKGIGATSGGDKMISSDLVISGFLNLSGDSRLVLGNNADLVLANTVTGVNASATSYIVTSGTNSFLVREVGSSPDTVLFPVGNANYNPAMITNSGFTDNYRVHVRDEVLDGGGSGSQVNPATTYVINHTWDIEEDLIGGSNASVRLQWNAGEENNPAFDYNHVYVSHYYSGSWHHDGYAYASDAPPASGTNPYTADLGGLTSFSPFTVGSAGGLMPLPVQLNDIRAANEGQKNRIEWRSADETNLDHYEAERSIDGQNFNWIASVTAAGRASDYLIYDKDPAAGFSYYHLKMVDVDG